MSSFDDDNDGAEDAPFGSESEYEYDSSSDDEYHLGEEPSHEHTLFNLEPIYCTICCDERVEEGCAIILPSCSHSFCIECFTKYLEVEIGQGNADSIVCPFIIDNATNTTDGSGKIGKQCNAPVAMEVLHEIMTQESYERLMQQKDAAFVRKNVDYHHCPTPDCANIVLCKSVETDSNKKDTDASVEGNEVSKICDCFKCGHTSCLTCLARPFHTNQTCNEHREEQRRIREERRRDQERRIMRRMHQFGRPTDRNRSNEEAKYDFRISCQDKDNDKIGVADNLGDALLENVKRCRRCGNGVELQSGCLKLKCLCGYRFCYQCGSENAQCDCTPSHHGFIDNKTGMGDFAGLRETKSYT